MSHINIGYKPTAIVNGMMYIVATVDGIEEPVAVINLQHAYGVRSLLSDYEKNSVDLLTKHYLGEK